MSSSNCCFLTCRQVSQEAGQVVWYSHLLQNFPQFIVIHTIESFGVVNKAEIDVFLNEYYYTFFFWFFVTSWTIVCQAPLSIGILPARIPEWVATPSSRGSSQSRDRTQVSLIAGWFFTTWATTGAQEYWSGQPILLGVFPTEGSNPYLLHCRQILHHWAT